MTVEAFKEMMLCNEPMFEYNGEEYSICWPGKKYYVTASDSPDDLNLDFKSIDDLLDNWIIQGKRLRDILPEIHFD